jgi:hypothetical protein
MIPPLLLFSTLGSSDFALEEDFEMIPSFLLSIFFSSCCCLANCLSNFFPAEPVFEDMPSKHHYRLTHQQDQLHPEGIFVQGPQDLERRHPNSHYHPDLYRFLILCWKIVLRFVQKGCQSKNILVCFLPAVAEFILFPRY